MQMWKFRPSHQFREPLCLPSVPSGLFERRLAQDSDDSGFITHGPTLKLTAFGNCPYILDALVRAEHFAWLSHDAQDLLATATMTGGYTWQMNSVLTSQRFVHRFPL